MGGSSSNSDPFEKTRRFTSGVTLQNTRSNLANPIATVEGFGTDMEDIYQGGIVPTLESFKPSEGGDESEEYTPEDKRMPVSPAASRFAQFQLRSGEDNGGVSAGKSGLINTRTTGLLIPEAY